MKILSSNLTLCEIHQLVNLRDFSFLDTMTIVSEKQTKNQKIGKWHDRKHTQLVSSFAHAELFT